MFCGSETVKVSRGEPKRNIDRIGGETAGLGGL